MTAEAEGYQGKSTAESSRTGTAAQELPQSVTVVTGQLMRDQGAQSMADVLRNVPGIVMAQGEGNRETPVLRGTATTADFFVDGLRDDLQYYRDLYNTEAVEVLTGPNGLLFGRGGSAGVINRVSKQAGETLRNLQAEAGSFGHRRVAADVGESWRDGWAGRLNTVVEDSGSYRDGVSLSRHGLAPALSFRPTDATRVTLQGEYFHDERTADRGVPSLAGKPLAVAPGQFFGDADRSNATATVRSLALGADHSLTPTLTLRHRSRWADYDKFYQNVFPGAVSAGAGTVSLAAYNTATARQNLLGQTDLLWQAGSGLLRHTVLLGVEAGRQHTRNRRLTGYFTDLGPNITSVAVPLATPGYAGNIAFRAGATDADNDGVVRFRALLLQDEIRIGEHWTLTLGARHEHLAVDLDDLRSGSRLASQDDLLSPRAGLTFQVTPDLLAYASYGRSFQPRAGEQLASLTANNAALDPEHFTNVELGGRWQPVAGFWLSAAAYELARGNVAVADPLDATRQVLVDGQRVKGLELSARGALGEQWNLSAVYARQAGGLTRTVSPTLLADARLAALPRQVGSLWLRYDPTLRFGVAMGLSHRGEILAATENLATPSANVTLPAYWRWDGALYAQLSGHWRLQANLENLLDRRYAASAHNNNNILPGAPRTIRLSLAAEF